MNQGGPLTDANQRQTAGVAPESGRVQAKPVQRSNHVQHSVIALQIVSRARFQKTCTVTKGNKTRNIEMNVCVRTIFIYK